MGLDAHMRTGGLRTSNTGSIPVVSIAYFTSTDREIASKRVIV